MKSKQVRQATIWLVSRIVKNYKHQREIWSELDNHKPQFSTRRSSNLQANFDHGLKLMPTHTYRPKKITVISTILSIIEKTYNLH